MDVGHCYLDGNADVVEFCPHNSFHHVLAASTYTLQEGDNPTRSGSISLFNINLKKLDLSYRLKTAGIFDMKWNPIIGSTTTRPLLAQADADGFLKIHHLKSSDNNQLHDLQEVINQKLTSSMCLCLDWDPLATSISVGHSDGSVSLTAFQETKTTILQEWKAHEFEVWATSFDPHQPHLVYTGSDDCKLKGWDLRNYPSSPTFQNSKSHQMGVCCIAKSPHCPYTLYTGSYDEKLRVWDVRSISRPVNEVNLGGGVWRIKNHSVVHGLILAACMHNGFAIVKVNGDEVKVVETYNKHESLAYGADWCRGSVCEEGEKGKTVIATCSFYDKLLRVWVPEFEIIVPLN
ncbi:hypothetical protein LXL04_009533 [Taraxacum kok-saghyz]